VPLLLRAITWVLLLALFVGATGGVTVCVEADGSTRFELAAGCCGSTADPGDGPSSVAPAPECLGCDDGSLADLERSGPAPSSTSLAASLALAPTQVALLAPPALAPTAVAARPIDAAAAPRAQRPASLRS
jgi:hypothetical protein